MGVEDFHDALRSIHEAGWTFDESARLYRRTSAPASSAQVAILAELQERYPDLPREVGEVTWSALTGNKPDAEIVGPDEHGSAKQKIVQQLVITEEFRERFYLRYCGKVPRFREVDWEIVIKAVERGHRTAPDYPYALLTLDTVDDVHGHHDHKTLCFSIGLHGLRRLIEELSELREHLEKMPRSGEAHSDATSG